LLNGLEKTLERKVPERERRWQLAEETAVYGVNDESFPQGWPQYHFPKLPRLNKSKIGFNWAGGAGPLLLNMLPDT